MILRRETWINIVLFCGLIALGLLGSIILFKTKPGLEKSPEKLIQTSVYTKVLVKQNLPVRFDAYGNTNASLKLQLRAQVPGVISYMSPHYLEGGTVGQNEVLIRLDQREYQLALEKAQASLIVQQSNLEQILLERGTILKNLDLSKKNLELNEKELERYAQMILEKTVTEQAYENILQKVQQQRIQVQNYENSLMQIPNRITLQKANIDSARVSVQEAMLRLEKTEIRAPYAAQVQGKIVETGEFLSAGAVLGTLVGLETLELEIPVPQSEIEFISQSMEEDTTNQINYSTNKARLVRVEPLGPEGSPVNGVLARFGASFDPRTRTIPVYIELKNTLTKGSLSDLYMHPGTFCKVSFEGKVIPEIYTVERTAYLAGKIQILREGRVRSVEVEIIRDQGELLWVRGALEEGDQLILRYNELHEDGKSLAAIDRLELP